MAAFSNDLREQSFNADEGSLYPEHPQRDWGENRENERGE
jgi:hypothetical protein